MAKNKSTEKRSALRPMDFFLIAVAALILAAVVGQSVAVYLADRFAPGDLSVTFNFLSVSNEDAESILHAAEDSADGIEVRYGNDVLAKVKDLTITPLDGANAGVYSKCDIRGEFVCKGTRYGEKFTIKEVGAVQKGDLLTVNVNGKTVNLQILSISAIEKKQ